MCSNCRVVKGFIKPAYQAMKITPSAVAQAKFRNEVEEQLNELEIQVKRVANLIRSKL